MLDLLPTPLLLVEPGSGRTLYANHAARRLAGGLLPAGDDVEAFGPDGRRLAPAELPAARVARGERLSGCRSTGEAGRAAIADVAGDHPPRRGRAGGVLDFEDVTALEQPGAVRDAGGDRGAAGRHLDYRATLGRSRSDRARIADWCFVEMLRPEGRSSARS